MVVLRTAVVGLGEVARWHDAAIEATADAELVAVADVEESRLDRFATRAGVSTYTGLDPLLRATDVDWVHICTPLQTHHDLAMDCIDRGVHVLVEKPFVRTRDEFDALTEAADRRGVRATVVHNQAYYRPFREACRRIERGEFGELHGVSVRWAEDIDPRRPDRGDWVLDLPGGEFGEGVVHPLYIGVRAAGYPADESAVGVERIDTLGDRSVEFDGIALSYVTDDDVACTIQHHSGVPDRRRIEFAAEDGHLSVDIGTQSIRTHRAGYGPNTPFDYPMVRGALRSVRNGVRVTARAVGETMKQRLVPSYDPHDTHTPVVRHEAKAIRGGGDGPTPREEADWTNRLFTTLCDT
jgi:predicted dehydrogenase